MAASSTSNSKGIEGEISGSSDGDNLVSRERDDAEDDRDSRDKDFAAVNVELVDGHVIMSDFEQPKPISKKIVSSTSAPVTVTLNVADGSAPIADAATIDQYQRALQKKDQVT